VSRARRERAVDRFPSRSVAHRTGRQGTQGHDSIAAAGAAILAHPAGPCFREMSLRDASRFRGCGGPVPRDGTTGLASASTHFGAPTTWELEVRRRPPTARSREPSGRIGPRWPRRRLPSGSQRSRTFQRRCSSDDGILHGSSVPSEHLDETLTWMAHRADTHALVTSTRGWRGRSGRAARIEWKDAS
jgi:hypothetical protein